MPGWLIDTWNRLSQTLWKWWSDLHPNQFFEGLVLLLLFVLLARLVRRLVSGVLTGARLDMQVGILVTRLAFLGVVFVGVLMFFSQWLGSPSLVFGSFGLFALAFGLAFQDVLKNFIAGVFLLLERPFRIGYEITVDNRTGVVENIEIRTTTMRTVEGDEVMVPNSIVYTQTILNRTRYPRRAYTLTAKIPASVRVDGLLEKVQEKLLAREEVLKDPPPKVGFQPSIDGGLTMEARYWLDYKRHDPLTVQAVLGKQIYDALTAAGQPAQKTS
jgi:small-conductance mechanosensitive channel